MLMNYWFRASIFRANAGYRQHATYSTSGREWSFWNRMPAAIDETKTVWFTEEPAMPAPKGAGTAARRLFIYMMLK
jgi:hypothetical protein